MILQNRSVRFYIEAVQNFERLYVTRVKSPLYTVPVTLKDIRNQRYC